MSPERGQASRVNPLVTAGDVLTLRPCDYCIGQTVLSLQVTYVPRYANFLASRWVRLEGLELRPDGTPWRERVVMVRVQAIIDAPTARPGPEARER
ncbi:hypothetical protein [Micromonospora haikouensis]|uniref:hypothetical protein n=1 Tax=Micromonospora haikouensis TaxID=686309 RepID=UPI0033E5CB26